MISKIQLLEYLTEAARRYRLEFAESVVRNQHLTEIGPGMAFGMPRGWIDAILVDFINKVGVEQGVDYALHVKDLRGERITRLELEDDVPTVPTEEEI